MPLDLRSVAGLSIAWLSLSTPALARDWRLGFSLGLGGAGISKQQSVSLPGNNESISTTVERSEGPGVFSVWGDYQMTDRAAVLLEHSRGFRLAPFSSGVSFTSVSGLFYFNPISAVTDEAKDSTVLVIKSFNYFWGMGLGVATGDIYRDGDLVPSVQSSGIFFGLRGGADYPLKPGVGLRPQISFSSTFASSQINPAQLSELAISCGIYFHR